VPGKIKGGSDFSANMQFNVNVSGTEEIQRLQRAVDTLVETQNKALKGDNLVAYYDEAASSIGRAQDAYQQFIHAAGQLEKQSAAEELLKVFNALEAREGAGALDAIASDFADVRRQCEDLAPAVAEIFSVKNFNELGTALEILGERGHDVQQLYAQLSSGDHMELLEQLKRAKAETDDLRESYNALKSEMASLADGVGVTKLESQVESLQNQLDELQDRFDQVVRQANNEFNAFLNTNNLQGLLWSDSELNDGTGRTYGSFLRDMLYQIQDGSLSAKQAIAEVTSTLHEFMHTGDSAVADALVEKFQSLIAPIQTVQEKLDALQAKMETMSQGGTAGTGNTAGIGETARTNAEALNQEGEAIGRVSQASEGLRHVADAIAGLSGDGSSNINEVKTSLLQLLGALQRLGDVDNSKLANISNALASISNMKGLAMTEGTAKSIGSMMRSLSQIPDLDRLRSLSGIDLSKMKISKAALVNMATYLPDIAKVQTGSLQALADIDWTRLNALHVTKGQVAGLLALGESQGIQLNNVKISRSLIGDVAALGETTSQRSAEAIAGGAARGLSGLTDEIAKIKSMLSGISGQVARAFRLDDVIPQYDELEEAVEDVGEQMGGVSAAGTTTTAENIEETTEALRDQTAAAQDAASAMTDVARAGTATQNGTAENLEDDAETLNELISLYVRYNNAMKEMVTARSNGVEASAQRWGDTARDLEAAIAEIEEANPALIELANNSQLVQKAMEAYANAEEKANAKTAESAEAAEAAIRKKAEAEAAAAAQQAAAGESAAIAEVVAQYEKYYDLMGKLAAAESAGKGPEAEYYARLADAVMEYISAIETLVPDLADQARRMDEVADAQSKYDLAVAKGKSSDEQKTLNELIDLYVRLNAARTDVARAYQAGGNNEATETARQYAASIKAQIDALAGANEALDRQAQAHARVREAVYRHNQALNSLKTDKINQEAAELAKLQKQLDGLSVDSKGIKFGGNAEMVAQYTAELNRAQAALAQIGDKTGAERAAAVANFTQIIASVASLRDELNKTFAQNKSEQSLQKQVANFSTQLNRFTQTNSSFAKANEAAFKGIFDALNNGSVKSQADLDQLKLKFAELQERMVATGQTGKTFWDQLTEGWARFGGWSLVTRSFTKVISTFKQAVTAVKEVDLAMTELRKVTDLTETEYDSFGQTAVKMATDVGAKVSDTVNAVAD